MLLIMGALTSSCCLSLSLSWVYLWTWYSGPGTVYGVEDQVHTIDYGDGFMMSLIGLDLIGVLAAAVEVKNGHIRREGELHTVKNYIISCCFPCMHQNDVTPPAE